MGVLSDFKDAVLDLIKLGPSVNQDGRRAIRDAVGSLADALDRALNLSIAYVILGKAFGDKDKLILHLHGARSELRRECKEYDICKNLYELRDRFRRTFDPVRHTVEMGSLQAVRHLISDLEVGERSVIDDLDDMIISMESFASLLQQAAPHQVPGIIERLQVMLDHEQTTLEKRRSEIKLLMRRVIDEM